MNSDTINMIAKDILDIDSLETQNSGKDFHELAVWAIKQALEEAYTAGRILERNSNNKKAITGVECGVEWMREL